jgi:acyl-coenzyme A thioesterase PaaI-like protein
MGVGSTPRDRVGHLSCLRRWVGSNVDSHTISESHFIGELGLTHWVDQDASYGRADITSEMLVPGTSFVRIGVLSTFADVVAGQPPSGAMNPTTDLSVHLDPPTEMSTVRLASRVVKAGATLVVIETRLTADHQAAPFATSLATFMNRNIQVTGRASQHSVRLSQPVAERIGARVTGPGTVEMMIRGDVGNRFGSVQGGVLAVLASWRSNRRPIRAFRSSSPISTLDISIESK